MVLKVGLDLPSNNTIARNLPSTESIAKGIESTPSLSELQLNNQALLANIQPTPETPDVLDSPQVFYSPSTRKMFVNGLMFDDDDAKTALQSVNQIKATPVKPSLDVATDWTRVSPQDYGSYIKGIKNPQAGRLFSENIDIGASNLKQLFGRASQAFGAEEFGQSLVDEATKELEKNEPFQREFANIKGGYIRDGDAEESHDAIDWFVANFGQQIPNLLESVVVALAGAAIGGVAGGPFGAIGGAITSLASRQSYKQAVIKAANKYQKDRKSLTAGERKLLREVSSLTAIAKLKTPRIFTVDSKGVAKKTFAKPDLDEAIKKGLPDAAAKVAARGKRQAQIGGALGATTLSSYVIGVGDIYGEQRETGQDNRLTAFLSAIPYAAFETLPEFVLGLRLFGVNPNKISKTLIDDGIKGKLKRGAARATKGFGVGAALEGATEVAQESLILTNTGQFNSRDPQIQKRLLNAFAAGAFVGGPIGGVANLFNRPSSDILNKNNQRTEPNDPLEFVDQQPSRKDRLDATRDERNELLRQQMKLPASAFTQTTEEINVLEKELNKKPAKDFPVAVLPEGTQLDLPGIETEAAAQTNKEINALKKLINKNKNKGDQLELDVGAPPIVETTTTDNKKTNKEINELKKQLDKKEKDLTDPVVADPVVTAPASGYAAGQTIQYYETDGSINTAEIKAVSETGATLKVVKKGKKKEELLSVENIEANPKDVNFILRSPGANIQGKKANELNLEETKNALTKLRDIYKEVINSKQKITGDLQRDITALRNRLEILKAEQKAEVNSDVLEEAIKTFTIFMSAPGVNLTTQEQQDLREGTIKLIQENNLDTIKKFNAFIRSDKFPRADDIRELDKTNKFIKDNNVDVNSEQFISEAQEVFGDMGPVLSRQFAAEQIIQQRNEQEGGTQDADTEQEATEVVTGKQARGSRTTTTGDNQETAIDTTKQDKLKKPVGKKTTGKKKLQAKKTEDATGQVDQKPVQESEDKTGEDNLADTRTVAERAADEREAAKNKSKDLNVAAAEFLKSKGKASKTDKKIVRKANLKKQADDAEVAERRRKRVEVSGIKFWNDNRSAIPGASAIEYQGFTEPTRNKIDELAKDSQKAGVLEELKTVWLEGFNAMIESDVMNIQDYVQLQIDTIRESNVAFEREAAYEEILNYTSSNWMGPFAGQNKKALNLAEGFLKEVTLDKDYINDLEILDALVIRKASVLTDAQINNIKSPDVEKRTWYIYAEARGLLPTIDKRRVSKTGGKLEPFMETSPSELDAPSDPVLSDLQKAQAQEADVAIIEKLIMDLLAGVGSKIYSRQTLHYETINKRYAKLNDEQKSTMINGTRLRFYFDKKTNKLKLEEKRVGNEVTYIPTTKTDAFRQAKLEKKLPVAQKEGKKEARLKRKTDAAEEARLAEEQAQRDAATEEDIIDLENDYNPYEDDFGDDGSYFRFDGTVANPLPKGKVKLIANQAVRQLKIKPKVTVVSNYADLEANYPKLYERARAGREQYGDDFGTVNAVGYSIGDEVIIFSDFVRTEQQLKFVIAHETIGHFGLKSLISQKQFNTVMQKVYDTDSHIRAVADLNIENGMEKFEAIEEALADAAAYLDNSTISRVINAIKVFLNKYLGTNFDAIADGSRYLINQSRRYLRTGDVGNYVSLQQLLKNIKQLEQDKVFGRYNAETYNDGQLDMLNKTHALNLQTGKYGGFAGAQQWIKEVFSNKSLATNIRDFKTFVDRKIEGLQSLNNLANKNEGSQVGYNVLQQIQAQVRAYVGKYAEMTPMTFKPNTLVPFGDNKVEPDTVEIEDEEGNMVTVDNDAGLTPLERQRVGELKAFAALHLRNKFSESKIAELGLDELIITKDKNGKTLTEFVYNEEAFQKIKEAAKLTKEDFEKGFTIPTALDKDGKALEEQGGYTYRASTPEETGEAPGQFEPFIISDRIFKAYEEATEVMAEGSKDVLEANIRGVLAQRDDVLSSIKDLSSEDFQGNHMLAIENIIKKYKELYFENHTVDKRGEIKTDKESVAMADEFLARAQRAMFEEKKLQDWINQDATEVGVYERENASEEFADIVSGLEDLNQLLNGKESKAYDIKDDVSALIALDLENMQTAKTTKASILGGYVPFTRRGDTQVTIRAYALDENGDINERVQLDDSIKDSLPYYQTNGVQAAESIRDKINDIFNPAQEGKEDRKYVPRKVKDASGEMVEVALVPEVSGIQEGQPFQNEMDIYLFTRKIRQLGFPEPNPKQRENIFKELSRQGDRARKSLERSGNPGWDADVLKNIAEHLEIQAHLVGRNYHRYKIDSLMDSRRGQKLWFGNKKKLDRLHKELKAAEAGDNQFAKEEARRKYDRYANQYRYSAGSLDPRIQGGTVTVYRNKGVLGRGEREAVEMPLQARGNDYKTRFRSLIDFYARNPNVSESTEDYISRSKAGQFFKLLTVTSQLGLSPATGFVNSLAMETHSVNYLAGYNPESGYGGGFGFMKSQKAMYKAFTQMNDIYGTLRNQFTTEEQYDGRNVDLAGLKYVEQMAGVDKDGNLLTNKKDQERAQRIRDKHGLSEDEARVIYETTKAGVLQASQYNALIGTARGGLGNVKLAEVVRKWMSIFSYTEQLNRRTTFLASYRLQKEKLMRAKNEETASAETIAEASAWARDAVNTSQGEYSMFNRPEISRGAITNYLMVYKQFMIISTELMSNMPRSQKIAFLAMLWLFSGLKGWPFAEDIADVLDTLIQKSGIKMGTIEKEANDFFEELLPGSAKIIMRGPLDNITGATMSTRLGMGDMLPLSGIGKAGADNWRETANFLGPVWSTLESTWATMSNVALATGSLIGLNDRQIGLGTILREQPFGGVRGISESIIFAMDGNITNRQGKVISRDVGIADIAFRFLNFYPAKANYQNDIIRMHKQTADYAKALKMEFTSDYVKARIRGDRDTMREVARDVARHNKKHKGTALEFRDWKKSADRAYDSWSLPAAERYRKFAPKTIRPDLKRIMDAYGVEQDM